MERSGSNFRKPSGKKPPPSEESLALAEVEELFRRVEKIYWRRFLVIAGAVIVATGVGLALGGAGAVFVMWLMGKI